MVLEPTKFLELYSQYSAGADVSTELLEELRPLAEVISSGFSDDSQYREDLIQECLERAYKSFKSYNPDKATPYNYFTSVFRNRCITVTGKYHEPVSDTPQDEGWCVDGSSESYDSAIMLHLIEHNRARFPSLDAEWLDVITAKIYTALVDGITLHRFLQHGEYKDKQRSLVATIFNASLVWLRQQYLHTTYYEIPELEECSILVDVRELLGDEHYELMCTVFAGMRLAFPNK